MIVLFKKIFLDKTWFQYHLPCEALDFVGVAPSIIRLPAAGELSIASVLIGFGVAGKEFDIVGGASFVSFAAEAALSLGVIAILVSWAPGNGRGAEEGDERF